MFVPNVNSRIYTLSAFFIGYFLLDDSTPAEQNSLGNWFMLVGQVLCTNSAQQQVLNNRSKTSNNTNQTIHNDSIEDELAKLNKIMNAVKKEIEILKQ